MMGVWSPVRAGVPVFGKGEVNQFGATLKYLGVDLLTLHTDRRSRRNQMRMKFAVCTSLDIPIDFIQVMAGWIRASRLQLILAKRAYHRTRKRPDNQRVAHRTGIAPFNGHSLPQ